MTRRASLPGAAELFRATSAAAQPEEVVHHPGVGAVPAPGEPDAAVASDEHPEPAPRPAPAPSRPSRGGRRIRAVGDRTPSGRERHEEKITVYCSADELVDLETARLHLRAEHGLAVDRGRIVREAVAVVLADLEAKGDSSILVRRLRGA
ncbi:MAG TPA: cobyrinic acid a,c-diamide synthase [Jatrophihabitantaceae bacterium]